MKITALFVGPFKNLSVIENYLNEKEIYYDICNELHEIRVEVDALLEEQINELIEDFEEDLDDDIRKYNYLIFWM